MTSQPVSASDLPRSPAQRSSLLVGARARLLQVFGAAVHAVGVGEPGLRPARVLDSVAGITAMLHDAWDLDPALAAAAPEVFEAGFQELWNIASAGRDDACDAARLELLAFAPLAIAQQLALIRPDWGAVRLLRYSEPSRQSNLTGIAWGLAEPRRWRRVQAAWLLQELGGPPVLDAATWEVDVIRAQHWLLGQGYPLRVV